MCNLLKIPSKFTINKIDTNTNIIAATIFCIEGRGSQFFKEGAVIASAYNPTIKHFNGILTDHPNSIQDKKG
jgi:hypothetical protein